MFDPTSPFSRSVIPELLAGAVYAVGHQPDHDLVVVLLTPGRGVCHFGCFDLDTDPAVGLDELLPVAKELGADRALVIGFGTDSIRPLVAALAAALRRVLAVEMTILVTGGRYRCLCDDPACPLRDPAPFDLMTATVTAELTARGYLVPSTAEDIRALLDPDHAARARTAPYIARLRPPGQPQVRLLARLLCDARAGVALTDADAARLAVALLDPIVLRLAWLSSGDQWWQRQLWLTLLRRIDDAHAAGPASLLAWCAWRRGETLLASLAARRATTAGPGNELAAAVSALLQSRLTADDLPWTPLPIPPVARFPPSQG
jgi:hypothetical protein